MTASKLQDFSINVLENICYKDGAKQSINSSLKP